MATSDNVVRAGLTPKLRDIPNLISGLTYTASQPSKHAVFPKPFPSSSSTTLYDPPIPEFSVLRLELKNGLKEEHQALHGPSIGIVTSGQVKIFWDGEGGSEGEELSQGKVFFIGAGTKTIFETQTGAEVYRAFVEA